MRALLHITVTSFCFGLAIVTPARAELCVSGSDRTGYDFLPIYECDMWPAFSVALRGIEPPKIDKSYSISSSNLSFWTSLTSGADGKPTARFSYEGDFGDDNAAAALLADDVQFSDMVDIFSRHFKESLCNPRRFRDFVHAGGVIEFEFDVRVLTGHSISETSSIEGTAIERQFLVHIDTCEAP